MSNEKTVKRFSKYIVIAHWTNAISFIMLVLTGLPLFLEVSVPDFLQIVHRVFAVTFLLPTPFMILMDRKGFLNWTKNAWSWKKYDFQFLAVFPLELIGKAKNIPKQDFFNGGQKLNSVLTIIGAIIMVCTGFIMWFKELFPKAVVQWGNHWPYIFKCGPPCKPSIFYGYDKRCSTRKLCKRAPWQMV